MMLKKSILFLHVIFMFLGEIAFAQQTESDSVRTMVFESLTRKKPLIAGTLTSQLKNTSWEALAYWDDKSPPQIEYMIEAVGDIYQFKASEFALELRNPEEAGSYLQPIKGIYKIDANKIIMSNTKGASLVAVVYYIDANYLVFDLDGLRIFLVKIKANANN